MTSVASSPPLIFDHVGIVAADVTAACIRFGSAIQAASISQRYDDPGLGVTVQFLRDNSGIVYEMIAPLGENSPVAKSLATKTSLLNQIAYRTQSIAESAAAMRRSGNFPLAPPKPALAFRGALVQFLFSPLGFVIELIESPAGAIDFVDFEGFVSRHASKNSPLNAVP